MLLMDVLSDILATLRLHSCLYFRAELSAPFSIAVPEDRDVIRFHMVAKGPCWVGLPTGESVGCREGDLVLIPHGAAHVLADRPEGNDPVPLLHVLDVTHFDGAGPLIYGGSGMGSAIVCGYFSFQHEITHPVIATLPRLLHVSTDRGGHFSWVERLLAYLHAETSAGGIGSQEIAQRLAEILFICVLREYACQSPHTSGALAALADSHLGNALRTIHADPAAKWSLDKLSARAAMSRTVFAERFRKLMGVTPARYVTLWRMHKARLLLEQSDQSIASVATSVGYESESTFTRAFKGYFGAPPGQYRRDSNATGP